MGFSLVPSTIVAMQRLPNRDSGLGSGLLNTSRLMGGALGLALLSTIAASGRHAHAGIAAVHALTHGFDEAMALGALFCVAGALVAATFLRTQAAPAPQPMLEPDAYPDASLAAERSEAGSIAA